MTADELRSIRLAALPSSTAAQFARLLGYGNPRPYQLYEKGTQDVPTQLAAHMIALRDVIIPAGLVDEWVAALQR